LLRMTAPRPAVAVASAARRVEPVMVDVPTAAIVEPVFVAPAPTPVVPAFAPEPVAAAPEAVVRDTHPDLAAGVSEIEKLAQQFRAAGTAAQKITILGTGQQDKITLTALTLARLLARSAKVVLVDLSPNAPELKAVSNDPSAPGLAELMLGEASFGQVITKDRMSALHIVNAGRAGADRALLQSPRLTMALDALLRVYDHVLLDAGTAADLPAGLLTSQARAVVMPEPSMGMEARALMAEQLKAVGFADVAMLHPVAVPVVPNPPGAHVAAA
ncbi:MAG: lipopolysaccharide biosynthesis, partial [Tardiphaga sp.]|nr:lipopolysaccharide biosynthesis [Tardiphaga sp.]